MIRDGHSSAVMTGITQSILFSWILFGFNTIQAQVIYEPYTFTTFAGAAKQSGSVDGNDVSARFYFPRGVGMDASGNIYVADSINNTIRLITPTGMVTTLAGKTPALAGSADGIGGAARFDNPYGITLDGNGTVFVADTYNFIIRKITSGAAVTTLAGSPQRYGLIDGVGAAARFWDPYGIAVDKAGNVYVADSSNNAIRKVTPSGEVTSYFANPPFSLPSGVAVDAVGNIYVADQGNHMIRRIMPAGSETTLAGSVGKVGSSDGLGSVARFNAPAALALDSSGNVFVADSQNCTIRKITPSGFVTTLAGLAMTNGSANGSGSVARFDNPTGIFVDAAGSIYVGDTDNNTIRKGVPAGGSLTSSVTTQPQSQTAVAGTNMTFTVSVSGLAPFSFQWRNGGIPIPEATNAFLTLTNVQFTDEGTYDVIVGNSVGTTNSSVAMLIVAPLIITSQPKTQTFPTGGTATFTVGVAGPSPFSYQWWQNGSPLAGATNTILTLTSLLPANAGLYSVAVSNALGFAVSSNALLTVQPAGAPLILQQPTDQFASVGSRATFTASATGVLPLAYQWLKNGTTIPNATNVSYATPVLSINDNANYSVVVSNSLGTTPSRNLLLTVLTVPEVILPLTSQNITSGESVIFTVRAIGTVLEYAWIFDGQFVPGATNASLAIPYASVTNSGSYTVVVGNPLGLAVTSQATLTVDPTPAIRFQPQPLSVLLGNPATFSVTALGEPPLAYQWRFNGGNLPGETNAVLTLSRATNGSGGDYSVKVSNAALPVGVNSLNALLKVTGPAARLSLVGNQAVLNFAASPTAFLLECTDGFGPAAVWTVIADLSTLPGTSISIIANPAAGPRFYRLRTP